MHRARNAATARLASAPQAKSSAKRAPSRPSTNGASTKPARNGKGAASKATRAVVAESVAKPRAPEKPLARAKAPTPPPTPPPAQPPVAAAAPRPSPAPHHVPYSALGTPIPTVPRVPAPIFKVGDKAVHPAHGVGEVTALEQRELGGTKQMFYTLKILDNGMKVMVPTAAATQVGLRGIMSQREADAILTTMRAREVAVDVQPWSRRFRVYTEMIKSGSPHEVAKVLRDMNRLKFDKDLSFGERRLLDQAKSLLMKELAFAKKVTEAAMAEEVKAIFSA